MTTLQYAILERALLVVQQSTLHIDDVLLFLRARYKTMSTLPQPQAIIAAIKAERTAKNKRKKTEVLEIAPPQTREQIFLSFAKKIATQLNLSVAMVLKSLQLTYGNQTQIPSVEVAAEEIHAQIQQQKRPALSHSVGMSM